MNAIYKYSLECGVLPRKPTIPISFFPLKHEKYIIIEQHSSLPEYLNTDELISYIYPYLKKQNIKILQIKLSQKDKTLQHCEQYEGLTTSQINFLIKNSILLISNSHYTCDISQTLNIPTIQIHTSIPSPIDKLPWLKSTHIDIDRNDHAESIATKTLKELGIKNQINILNPIFCGNLFHKKILEINPDFNVLKSNFRKQTLNIRADYSFNEQNIFNILITNYCNLIINKYIDLSKLPDEVIDKNLLQINFEIDINTKQEHIDHLKSFNKPLNLFCRDSNEITNVRLKFIDEIIALEQKITKKDLDICDKICENTVYKSSKMIISKGKYFTSKAAMDKNLPIKKDRFERIIDEPSFWNESEHLKLININNG